MVTGLKIARPTHIAHNYRISGAPRLCVIALQLMLCALATLLSLPPVVIAEERTRPATENSVKIYLLQEQECGGCDRAQEFLGKVAEKDTWMTVTPMDMKTSELAKSIYSKLLELFSVPVMEFPVIVVGTHAVTGYIDDRTTGMEVLGRAQFCRWFGCDDIVEAFDLNGETIIEVQDRKLAPARPCLPVTWKERNICAVEAK